MIPASAITSYNPMFILAEGVEMESCTGKMALKFNFVVVLLELPVEML
jgi:hypothetical protein